MVDFYGAINPMGCQTAGAVDFGPPKLFIQSLQFGTASLEKIIARNRLRPWSESMVEKSMTSCRSCNLL